MRVHVVCRLNQARSIITSALLRKRYPELQVFSSGIAAHNAAPVPQFIIDIAHRWELEELDYNSTLFELGEPVRQDDLVLCADHSIFEHLRTLNLPGELIDVTQYSLVSALIPHDPLQLSREATEIELAKMVISTVSALESHMSRQKKFVCTALFVDSNNTDAAIDFLRLWLEESGGYAIDMNWKIPDIDFWSVHGLPVQRLNPRRFLLEATTSTGSMVICSTFEIDNVIELLTTHDWREFLSSLGVPILLIIADEATAPFSATSIFSLIGVSEIVSISKKSKRART